MSAALMRRAIEDAIERLVAALDELDGDPDLEPDIGWPERWGLGEETIFAHTGDDREEDHDREAEPVAV